MIGYVYITTNDINNIAYIGKRQKPRFEKSYKGSGTHLKLAFSKYGKSHFHTSILEWCETVKELNAAEKRWIKKYRDDGKPLYNIAEGGDGGNMVDWSSLPKWRREEIRQKNRNAHIGKKMGPPSEEHREKIRQNARRFKPVEEIEKEKATKRRNLPPIVQLEKDTSRVIKRWTNWGEAGDHFRKEHGRTAYAHISECCQGKRRSAYGYAWKYETEAVAL